ncbi:MAG TPA: hypothetical protein VGM64_03215 [Lacunisphaera sp.]
MLKPIFTLDYEIHGNGDGCPYRLMVEPTRRMMDQFDRYGAKLTILADMGEILRFKQYWEEKGRDDYHYCKIRDQLQDAIRRGHDVQLHLHSSYFNARHEGGHWIQDWSEYNFAGLPPERAREMIRLGKEYLEKLLQPVDPAYRCVVFRAANWSMSPSRTASRALIEHGFTIDTSVFKYGRRSGLVNFDYTHAPSNVVPWRASEDDVCKPDPSGNLYEFPIYSENRWIGAFFSINRIYRAALSKLHRTAPTNLREYPSESAANKTARPSQRAPLFARKSAWKADFNQCSGRQLIHALKRAEAAHGRNTGDSLPFVLIGHSKIYTRFNEWSLRPFLAFVANHRDRFAFAKFSDFSPLPAATVAAPLRTV